MNDPDFGMAFAFAKRVEQPAVLARSNECLLFRDVSGELAVAVWSHACQAQSDRGVVWHDDAEHCPSWNVGCCCDLGEHA